VAQLPSVGVPGPAGSDDALFENARRASPLPARGDAQVSAEYELKRVQDDGRRQARDTGDGALCYILSDADSGANEPDQDVPYLRE